ncbi:hypothetical protein FGE12_03370 [Aggregicoccus sp. 17bor-14]|uniref:myxosortase-dependent metalloprotease, MXAN_2677/MXAN_2678 family n=1 Tax=Myxococcaceae TaxID=31 RepID=UPI00129CAEE4|nr:MULTISPECIES: myxosortase-dependent metalloprotease, MXAN_2677/MXAN_2678 family [Myxococcaceae]MBF5041414.1 hypothetical protein [Simulacricoccus sp. 17bor-14]MRI87198.1 hypothetical protein [Aggregicoccus sp. 17bor-14]
MSRARGVRLLWAGACLLAAGAAHAQDFRRTAVPGKPLCLYWPVREYVYHYDAAGSARTPERTELAAMEAAFDSWRTLSGTCSDFAFVRGADLEAPDVAYVPGGDNVNVLTFRERACDEVVPPTDPCFSEESCANRYRCWSHDEGTLALTTTTFSFRSGAILDADIEFNAAPLGGGEGYLFTTVAGPPCGSEQLPSCVAIDLQNTLTHELGHVVGLDHVLSTGSTMEATAPPGETQKRILDPGTAEGFCGIYPRGQPSVQCVDPATVREQLVARGEGLSGLGCTAAGGEAAPLAGALGLLALGRRRRRRAAAGG